MIDVVVDMGVMLVASGKGDRSNDVLPCRGLLACMLEGSARLVLDDEGMVRAHYARNLGSGYGMRWVTSMATRGKVRTVRRARFNKDVLVKLGEAGFDQSKEDFKYYARAAAGAGAYLVTLDPHFEKNARLLKREGIIVVDTITARSLVDMGPA